MEQLKGKIIRIKGKIIRISPCITVSSRVDYGRQETDVKRNWKSAVNFVHRILFMSRFLADFSSESDRRFAA